MRNPAKLITASLFSLGAMIIFLTGDSSLRISATGPSATPTASAVTSKASPIVTPTAGALQTASTAASSTTASPVKSAAPENLSGASIGQGCCDLDKDEWKGLVKFDHDAHALKASYSEEGRSPARCVECHHTDQPNVPMSDRTFELTYAKWNDLTDKTVKNCKVCHFSQNDPPDPKPEFNGKVISDNYYAYHKNCTVCHAAAVKRPGLKPTRGFATKENECYTCHAGN